MKKGIKSFQRIRLCYIKFLIIAFQSSQLLSAQTPTNVVLIVSDDQGYYDFNFKGNEEIITPNLDKLAKEGANLTNFYVTSSICTPSRSGLLTGRYPQRNGTYELFRNDRVDDGHQYTWEEYETSPERILGTDLREVFISEILKEAGYTNGIFGKWDLGQLKRFLPLQQGFDDFYGHVSTGMDYFTHERYGIPTMYDGNELSTEYKGRYATDLFEEKSIEFLEKNKDKPFFLFVPFTAPHAASNLDPEIRGSAQATQEYMDMYESGTTQLEKWKQSYKAAVTAMDASIGTILKFLEEENLEENTMIIFLSDNGGSYISNNYPLRNHKGSFFEGGIRVPCIVKWKGKIAPNTQNNDFLTSLEIFPTILEATDTRLPDSLKIDGFSMMPNLLNMECENIRNEMFWELRGDYAARIGDWKWIQSSKGNGLFNLSNDIGETKDLSKVYPEKLKNMKEKFYEWQKSMKDSSPRGPFKNY